MADNLASKLVALFKMKITAKNFVYFRYIFALITFASVISLITTTVSQLNQDSEDVVQQRNNGYIDLIQLVTLSAGLIMRLWGLVVVGMFGDGKQSDSFMGLMGYITGMIILLAGSFISVVLLSSLDFYLHCSLIISAFVYVLMMTMFEENCNKSEGGNLAGLGGPQSGLQGGDVEKNVEEPKKIDAETEMKNKETKLDEETKQDEHMESAI